MGSVIQARTRTISPAARVDTARGGTLPAFDLDGARHRRGDCAHGGRGVSQDAAVPVHEQAELVGAIADTLTMFEERAGSRNQQPNLTAKTPSPRNRQTSSTAPDKRLMNQCGRIPPTFPVGRRVRNTRGRTAETKQQPFGDMPGSAAGNSLREAQGAG